MSMFLPPRAPVTYTGYRVPGARRTRTVVRRWVEGCWQHLDAHREGLNRGATEYDWGKVNAGALQLAYALAYDVTADERLALDVYELLCDVLVGEMPKDGWILSGEGLWNLCMTIWENPE